MPDEKRYRLTQPCCVECYEERYSREPSVLVNPESEQCCFCGKQNFDGIYIRVDPTDAPYPSLVSR